MASDPEFITIVVPALDEESCIERTVSGLLPEDDSYELLVVDDRIRTMIHRQTPESEIKQTALANGMHTMRGDAQRWIDSGATSLEEVLRVTRD